MRVAPAALLARSLDEALELAHYVTAVTHNHPEGMKGAQATAMAIYLSRVSGGQFPYKSGGIKWRRHLAASVEVGINQTGAEQAPVTFS